jgi:hypothetical protein
VGVDALDDILASTASTSSRWRAAISEDLGVAASSIIRASASRRRAEAKIARWGVALGGIAFNPGGQGDDRPRIPLRRAGQRRGPDRRAAAGMVKAIRG